MFKKFCPSCGHTALADFKFCEKCGVALDEVTLHDASDHHPPPNHNPFASLYDFVKQHLAVVNGVVLFSGTVVGVLDFCVPVLRPFLVILYWMTGVLSVLMLLAALFPVVWLNVISKLGYSNAEGKHTAVPLHKRDAWRGAVVLLMGVTAAGVVSLAKANQGGALASNFPSLKTLQESMLSLNQKTDQIQMGVKDANSKLDILVDTANKELSPREILAKEGVTWDANSFWQALNASDVRLVKLFLSGGFNARSAPAPQGEDGTALGLYVALSPVVDEKATVEILRLLAKNLELTDTIAQFRGLPQSNLPSIAVSSCNLAMARALVKAGVDLKKIQVTSRGSGYGAMTVDPVKSLQQWTNMNSEAYNRQCTASDRQRLLQMVGASIRTE